MLAFQTVDSGWKAIFTTPSNLLSTCLGMTSTGYLINNIVLFMLWLGFDIYSVYSYIVDENNPFPKYFIYLTYLGNILLAVYLGFQACCSYLARQSEVPDSQESATPIFVSVTWFFGAAMPPLTLTIAILYWVLVYEPGGEIPVVTVLNHGGNVVVALYDLLCSSRPFYFAHFYASVLLGLLYALFSYIYYVDGGKDPDGNPYIYKSLDSSKPQAAGNLVALLAIIGIPVLYSLCYIIVAIRVYCANSSVEATASKGAAVAPKESEDEMKQLLS